MIKNRFLLSIIDAIKNMATLLVGGCGVYDLTISGFIQMNSIELLNKKPAVSIVLFCTGIIAFTIHGICVKYPDQRLKKVYQSEGTMLYSFAFNPRLVISSSVEIYREDDKGGLGRPYAIAFVDRQNELNKRQMIVQHMYLYDKGKYYNCEERSPQAIREKDYGKFYYRPFIANKALEGLEKEKSYAAIKK